MHTRLSSSRCVRVLAAALCLGFAAGARSPAGEPAYSAAVLADEPLYYWSFDEPGDFGEAVNLVDPSKPEDRLVPQGAARRANHADIGGDPILGRCAEFDGARGARFYAPDLGGGAALPGADLILSQLWAVEFWFKVEGSTAGNRSDYFLESIGMGSSNNPGLIYDFTPPDYIEMFRGARTGTAGPQVRDNSWHHAVFAFYGNSAGFGDANGDGAMNITDGIYILNYLFLGGPDPAPPGPPGEGPCGPDPTTGSFLGCASYTGC